MEKGHQGYINTIKKKSLMAGLGCLAIVFVLYFTGLILNGSNGSIWTLFAVFFALPTAQFFARFLSLREFGSVSGELIRLLDRAQSGTVLYEIPLLMWRKTYFIDAVVIEDETLFVYSRDKSLMGEQLCDFMAQKGVYVKVKLFHEPEAIALALKLNERHDYKHLGEAKKVLLGNSL